MKKIILILFLIFFCRVYFFSDALVLRNGKIIKGELVLLNKKIIRISSNYNISKFNVNDINYLINDIYTNEKYLLIQNINKRKIDEKILFVKAANNVIYYYLPQSNLLKYSYLNKVYKINYEVKIPDGYNINNYILDQNKDIPIEFNDLINSINNKNNHKIDKDQSYKNTGIYNYISIKDNDFYERYWANINKYIGNSTKNLIWNLFEIYSEKEKQLNIIFNEEMLNQSNDINNVEPNENYENKIGELKNKIYQLRSDFFFRSKKIIINSEFLTNTTNISE